MIDALRRASAHRITAVMPYFGYARKDRKDEGARADQRQGRREHADGAGVDRVLTLDLHAAQIQGFFDIPVDHLYATPVFALDIRAQSATRRAPVVVARRRRDHDGARLREALAADLAIVDKRRDRRARSRSST